MPKVIYKDQVSLQEANKRERAHREATRGQVEGAAKIAHAAIDAAFRPSEGSRMRRQKPLRAGIGNQKKK